MADADLLAPGALEGFLGASPAAGWARAPLAGDASGRRYERLTAPDGRSLVLMDARAEPASIPPFLRIAAHLRGLGLAAPAVVAEGPGLLLLEDLGPATAADVLDADPGLTLSVLGAAVEVLARLQAAPPPADLTLFTPTRMAGLVAPLFDHFRPGTDPRLAADLTGRLAEALARHAPDPSVLALRDFHAQNLVWRPLRAGTDRLGLLDFQDAVAAPPEYDLASLLRDARRDLAEPLRADLAQRFAALTGRSLGRVEAAAAVLGVQRNLRILGVFARLAAERGKPAYLTHVPRLRAHLAADLAHPACAGLREPVAAVLGPA